MSVRRPAVPALKAAARPGAPGAVSAGCTIERMASNMPLPPANCPPTSVTARTSSDSANRTARAVCEDSGSREALPGRGPSATRKRTGTVAVAEPVARKTAGTPRFPAFSTRTLTVTSRGTSTEPPTLDSTLVSDRVSWAPVTREVWPKERFTAPVAPASRPGVGVGRSTSPLALTAQPCVDFVERTSVPVAVRTPVTSGPSPFDRSTRAISGRRSLSERPMATVTSYQPSPPGIWNGTPSPMKAPPFDSSSSMTGFGSPPSVRFRIRSESHGRTFRPCRWASPGAFIDSRYGGSRNVPITWDAVTAAEAPVSAGVGEGSSVAREARLARSLEGPAAGESASPMASDGAVSGLRKRGSG